MSEAATIQMTEAKVRRIRYECAQCEAEDFAKLYPHEPTPPAINCWKCHAGHRVDMGDMIARHQGMFPTGEVDDQNRPIGAE